MNYNPIKPRSYTEASVLLLAAFVWSAWQMPYTACAVALINYGYAILKNRHAIGYAVWAQNKPKQKEQKTSKLSESEDRLQTLLTDRGFPATVIGSLDSFRREVFEIRLPRSFKIKTLMSDIADIERATGIKHITIESSVTGKPGVSRILVPKTTTPPPIKMMDIMETDTFKDAHPMSLPLGINLSGQQEYRRLDKLPHLIIAGTTGAGKSVELNAWITSLIAKNSVDDLKMVLIDPKMLELSIYEKSQHLAMPVVTEMSDALGAINKLVMEMNYRYHCMSLAKTREIDTYNETVSKRQIKNPHFGAENIYRMVDGEEKATPAIKSEHIFADVEKTLTKFPKMVLVIDEMADLMMMYGEELELPIVRLAQKARACGIHLILATQRPQVSVITGLIKSNIAARFAMQVATDVDSRIIMDRSGAQNLLGNGDGYFAENQGKDMVNVQGFFIEAHEIEAFINKQNAA